MSILNRNDFFQGPPPTPGTTLRIPETYPASKTQPTLNKTTQEESKRDNSTTGIDSQMEVDTQANTMLPDLDMVKSEIQEEPSSSSGKPTSKAPIKVRPIRKGKTVTGCGFTEAFEVPPQASEIPPTIPDNPPTRSSRRNKPEGVKEVVEAQDESQMAVEASSVGRSSRSRAAQKEPIPSSSSSSSVSSPHRRSNRRNNVKEVEDVKETTLDLPSASSAGGRGAKRDREEIEEESEEEPRQASQFEQQTRTSKTRAQKTSSHLRVKMIVVILLRAQDLVPTLRRKR